MRLSNTEVIQIYTEVNAEGGKTTVSVKIHICSQRQLQIMNVSASGMTIIIIIIIIIIYISPSIDPLQGQRPTGCGSSQGTLSGYKE